MRKEIITVPAEIRYISDWADKSNGYHLEDYPFKHIMDKQLTGCGFTEYCLRNNLNIILCSPRRMLLENKIKQHSREPNVMYFRNEVERIINPSSIGYDKDIVAIDNSSVSTKSVGLARSITTEQMREKREELARMEVLKLREDFSNNFKNIYCPWKTGYKILVTYDSFRHVKEMLREMGILDTFFVVIDEFQAVFIDSRFKSEAELELLYNLQDLDKVCYVSATPMLDKYLEMLDEFKDLPYYEFDWITENPARVIKPGIDPIPCNSITKELNEVINSYQNGKFEVTSFLDETGKIIEVESREAVIYVNSVKHICRFIKHNGLTPEETNVLCARTPENEKKVREAFKSVIGKRVSDFKTLIGTIPTYGEPHKMFTFCTRTVYLGADFYSTNARTFIASDANLDTLSVDISLDLPQILGRQRLDCNPWKNRAVIFYKTITGSRLEDAKLFEERIEAKKKKSAELLRIYYNDVKDDSGRTALATTYRTTARLAHYQDDYISVNEHAKSGLVPVMNKLVMVSDIRTFEIQQMEYRDRAAVLNQVERYNEIISSEIDAKVNQFYDLENFKDRMRLVCTTGFDTINQQYFLRQIPVVFGNYYNTIGPENILTILSHNASVKSEYERIKMNQEVDIKSRILSEFSVGSRVSLSDIKNKLKEIYEETEYDKTPKAIDILNYFNCNSCNVLREDGSGKRDKGFEIISVK